VHDLGTRTGIDLWRAAREAPGWLPGVDAEYGSSVYLPLADGAVFEVSMSQSGLLARPAGETGEEAVRRWR
jgi:hypothetical protein